MSCDHTTIAVLIIGVAFLIFWTHRDDGFRSREQKIAIATQLVEQNTQKPEFNAMKSVGLDGAEFYTVRQLWNNGKYTKDNIARAL